MVGKVIRDYMEGGGKKLTVPAFGTFMRRENGEVIFVDLLRGDDRTLSEMVEDAGGYSEVEAMALIDRFIFETKTAIERHGSATIEGFGTMMLDHKGVYQFRYSPKARPVQEHAVQETLFTESPEQARKVPQQNAPQRAARPTQSPASRPSAQHSAPASQRPANNPATAPVGRQQPSHPQSRPQPRPAQNRNRPQDRRPKKQKLSNTDTILVVAIAAAAIALIAMIFAFSAGNMPFLQN